MRKLVNVSLFFLLTAFTVHAQSNGKVTGKVEDAAGKSLEATTISLLRATDSTIVKMTAADKGGTFQFEGLENGRYLVSATAVGFQMGYSESVEIDKDHSSATIKPIQLLPTAKSLSGVAVTAKRPLIEQKVDRMVVNVDASPTNVGNSAMDVLEKSPGVSVDKDGNISLKGKEGVLVLVDGRPTQLSGADLANLLRSMNSSQLDQIEIMTNPPAKYDAAGNAGIINIKTKKSKQFGYNGTVNLGYAQGRYAKYNESLNFNYRKNKVNVFTNLSHYHWESFENLNIQRKFRNENTKELLYDFDQQARMHNENNSYNGKLGMDFFASKNTTLGFVLNGQTSPGTWSNRNNIDITDALNNNAINVTKAQMNSNSTFKNWSTNLNFRQVLDTTGRELTSDIDYITYDSRSNQTLSNYYFDNAGNTLHKGDTLYGLLPQKIKIASGKVDYVQPMKKNAKFEAGIKTSFVKTDNNAQYNVVDYAEMTLDSSRSNYFIYRENINAAYANYSRPLTKKWNMQLGLRLENTTSTGHTTGYAFDRAENKFVGSDTSFKRSYTNLFPTAYFQYASNKNNSFGINYGRRIRRPNYQSLNPFIEYIDRYTFEEGNPNLRPQFSHNIELSHTYKNFLTTTLNYTRTNDIIQEVIEQNNATNETFIKRANIASQRQYGIAVNVGKPVTKWWNLNLYTNLFNDRYQGVVGGEPITVDATMVMVNGSQQFTLSKKLTAELEGWYRSAGVFGVIRAKGMGALSIGASQKLLKDKATLKLNVRDIFRTQHFSGVSRYANVDAAFQNSWDSRQITLGFSYRFNKGKIENKPSRKTGGADDEQSRVGKGGN